MNKEKIKIGIVSKGRLKEDSEKVLKKKKLRIFFERGKRELKGKIKGRPNISVSFMHAREILDQLSIGNLDIGISGLDLLKESEINIQKNIKLEKKLNFGFATLVLACPNEFIDLFTTLDLDEVAEDYKKSIQITSPGRSAPINKSPTETVFTEKIPISFWARWYALDITSPRRTNAIDGGIIWPKVPVAATSPEENFLSYPTQKSAKK